MQPGPLKFHKVHGASIKLDNDGRRASSTTNIDSCRNNTLAFSSRPIEPDERVLLRHTQGGLTEWTGNLRIGVTTVDPATLSYEDLNSEFAFIGERKDVWIIELDDRYTEKSGVVQFNVSSNGDLRMKVMGVEEGISDIPTKRPLWVIIDIYGTRKYIEFVNPRTDDNNNTKISLREADSMAVSTTTFPIAVRPSLTPNIVECRRRGLCFLCGERGHKQAQCPTRPAEFHVTSLERFHPLHGSSVKLENNCRRATSTTSDKSGLVFSSRPIKFDERVFLRHSHQCAEWSGTVRIGVTSVDPATLTEEDLCEESVVITGREGYWIRAVPPKYTAKDGVIQFEVSRHGDLRASIDGVGRGVILKDIAINRLLWAVIDVKSSGKTVEFENPRAAQHDREVTSNGESPLQYSSNVGRVYGSDGERQSPRDGSTNEVTSTTIQLHELKESLISDVQEPRSSGDQLQRVKLSLMNDGQMTSSSRDQNQTTSSTPETCTICYVAPPNAVILNCAHRGACVGCALKIKTNENEEQRLCPFCREQIMDVAVLISS